MAACSFESGHLVVHPFDDALIGETEISLIHHGHDQMLMHGHPQKPGCLNNPFRQRQIGEGERFPEG